MASADLAAWLQAGAGVLTFGAAAWAVLAAYRAPKLAASFAEQLRRDHAAEEEAQREKKWILSTLMRYRGQMLHHDVVSALNMIDIAFLHSKDVREAYQQYWTATNTDNPFALRRERFFRIIAAIAGDLGLSQELRVADIERSYYPQFVGRRIEVELAETDLRWDQLHNPDGSRRSSTNPQTGDEPAATASPARSARRQKRETPSG